MNEQTRMRILREVALRAEGFYAQAENLGGRAARALSSKKRAQMTGLEGIANGALKTTDVFDYIKLRTARQKEWRKDKWGEDLLNCLRQDLSGHKQTICDILHIDAQSAEGLEVHLLLMREFVRQVAAHYEYACAFRGAEAEGGEG